MDRFRLNATVRPAKSLAFVVQAQDARAFDKTAGSQAAPFRDTLDLRMAYGEIGATHAVRIGRQELAFGEQRLHRPSRLGQHRALVRRSAGHDQREARADRRFCGVGRDD